MFVALAAAHAAAVIAMPAPAVIALGVWWNANTIAHNFIHHPFFRRPAANQAFAAALSVLNGIPQSLWRDRHLAHHRGLRPRAGDLGCRWEIGAQSMLILSAWTAMATQAPRFFLTTYLPGYLGGLTLCALHGYYEHARGTTSYYGRLYNLLLFNDGYHVEHHANPDVRWRDLPARRAAAGVTSRWPAPVRWLECIGLDALERLVLRSTALQRYVVRRHFTAWRQLAACLPPISRVTIIGGGLFPRSALVVRRLWPAARITIVDASADNLDRARRLVGDANVEFVHGRYEGGACHGCDLLVIPLAFKGDRDAIYAAPASPAVLVHDWIWRRRGESRVVSIALLKRLNLVVGQVRLRF